ncbi:hypothetical protein [Shimazuella kribbensis]|uniref:hypothetical protein n=1 Tax=Shimazuella kribbensis TaxID=139808 RepID=UPI000424CA6C|nr:hypothetical protein [Shimazuella kribbensis]
MQRIFCLTWMLICWLFISGCGLVTFSSEQTPKDKQQVTQQKPVPTPNMFLPISSSSNQINDIVGNKPIFEKVHEKIITVIRENKPVPSIPPKVVIPVDVVVPKPQPPIDSDPNPSPNPPVEEPKNDDEGSNQEDEKYQAAVKKANELKNTDQQVTADQGNVYEKPEEKSSVLLQVIKEQKLHVGDTKVDEEDAEIWCYVSGNDGQKDIIGWITYPIIEQK